MIQCARVLHAAIALVAACVALSASAASSTSPTVQVYAAGSLRGVVTQLAAKVKARYAIRIVPTFGGSGALRGRIEGGAPADLLLSADTRSPRKLASEGRTVVPTLAIARNRICVVAPRAADVTPQNFVARVLAPDTRTWASQPVADPGGDYAAAIFKQIEAHHPHAGPSLEARAQAVRTATAQARGKGLAKFAGLFAQHRIDLLITYCSGAPALQRQAPALASFPIPARLDPHPVYGMAVLSAQPATLRVALYLLSPAGQAIVAHHGLIPITKP